MSKRIPLVGEELAAYEEEQNRKRKEEALKATLIKEEESRATLGSEQAVGDPMIIDAKIKQPSSNGTLKLFFTLTSYASTKEQSILVDLELD